MCPLRLAVYGHPDSGGGLGATLHQATWHCGMGCRASGKFGNQSSIILSLTCCWLCMSMTLKWPVQKPTWQRVGSGSAQSLTWILLSLSEGISDAIMRRRAMLPREAHPFAYVFDKKHAAPPEAAAHRGLSLGVDPEVGAVIRRHIYPCKKLYVPTEDHIKLYPTLQTQ